MIRNFHPIASLCEFYYLKRKLGIIDASAKINYKFNLSLTIHIILYGSFLAVVWLAIVLYLENNLVD